MIVSCLLPMLFTLKNNAIVDMNALIRGRALIGGDAIVSGNDELDL